MGNFEHDAASILRPIGAAIINANGIRTNSGNKINYEIVSIQNGVSLFPADFWERNRLHFMQEQNHN